MQAAEAKIRALKASGTATAAEVRQAVLDFAAARIRDLKAARAPQEEVKAAIEKLIALEAIPEQKAQETKQACSDSGCPEMQAAEAKIRALKAGGSASQADVRRAVLDYAETRIRSKKAQMAPQEEVKAAVLRLLELEKIPFTEGAAAQKQPEAKQPETKQDEAEKLRLAEAKVRALKDKGAPQADVRRAVLDYAEARIVFLKATSAPQAEVKQAVEKLLAAEAIVFPPKE